MADKITKDQFDRAYNCAIRMPWEPWNEETSDVRKRQIYLFLCEALELDPTTAMTDLLKKELFSVR